MKKRMTIALVAVLVLSMLVIGFAQASRSHWCYTCKGQQISSEILYRCPDCHGSVATKVTYKCGTTETFYYNHSGCMQ